MAASSNPCKPNKRGYRLRLLLRAAVQSLLQQKLRSLLSILGIVCGIMAVVTVIAIGKGAEQETMHHIEQLGINNIYIRADQLSEEQQQRARQRHSAGLQDSDRERLGQNNPFIQNTAGIRERTHNLIDFPQGLHPQLMECTASYGEILDIRMAKGRFISETDLVRRQQVCALGWQIATGLGEKGQLNQEIRIGEQLFLVIGILARQDELNTEHSKVTMQDLNNSIFFPLDTLEGGSEEADSLTELLIEVRQPDQIRPCA
ncbi:MAG: hypothetical protein D3908_02840, partial [Candidatus Electrothrix sp. AUS4]|nr:hypothetical protein [Candidatus Electrothrix sp. AUS4]